MAQAHEELVLFAKTLLRERYDEFAAMLAEFEKSDRKTFVRKHRKLFDTAVFDTDEYDDIGEETLFLGFAIQAKRMFYADWAAKNTPDR